MTDFHICWSIDCESNRRDVNDLPLGRRAIEGFCEILESVGWTSTLFLMPEEIESMSDLLGRKADAGHEIALHLHPDESGFRSGCLGVYSYDEQMEIVGKAMETFERILGIRPESVRPGFGSANDATFPVMAEMGIRQTSASMPGRKMSAFAANWAGAPLFTHYAHPDNRFLEGGLDLVEFPISVDWETMIWGGIHPQDIRVEYTDVKNHVFTIRKIMQRQVTDNLLFKALLPFTHNLFEYSDKSNFRRETMEGMIEEIIRFGESLDVELIGCTLHKAAAVYRSTSPL